MRRKGDVFVFGFRLLALLAVALNAVSFSPSPAQAETNTLTLRVVSARNEPDHPGGPVTQGQAISDYQFLINVDNTGDPTQAREAGCSSGDPGYPDSCDWPSIRAVPGAAPIYTQGDQTILNEVAGIENLPAGKYLISVVAEGYKIGGAHFTVPLADPGLVTVALQPHPLPPATMRIKVFEDISSTNGQFDAPAEQGLAGFTAVINDILGQISTDVFGNPLCTQYDAAGEPIGQTNCLVSDANGDIIVPNLGPNRYDVNITPPVGQGWVQTTTLEGSHSWDTWLQEGGTGLDNEFVNAGEPFPWTVFGFARPTDQLNNSQATGGVQGTIVSAAVYVPWGGGGLPYYGGEWGGLTGAKVTGPIQDAWVALSDLQNGDTAVYIAPANPDGAFSISNVPDGNYLFTYWDYRQHYILDWMQVTVANGQMTDLGTPFLTGWFTWVEGYVFNDLNSNGKKDAGEPGISDYMVLLKDRDNTEIDRMTIAVTTDANGYYYFDRAYPMGAWMILEAYSDRYYTTGVTYQVENQPEATTVLGAGVDIGILPILGQTGRLDWGVRPYDPGTNGGIVGTVFYDTTRNELDAAYQAVEGWAPGIPDLELRLYQPVECGANPTAECDPSGMFELAPDGSIARLPTAGGLPCGTTPGANCDPSGAWEIDAAGAFVPGPVLNTAVTETWEHPVNCQARDALGAPVVNQQVLPPATGDFRCLEGPLMGLQFQNGFATLDGNYGFGTIFQGFGSTAAPTEVTLPAGDYIVEVVIPQDDYGRPKYQVVREEDINVFNGDEFIPQIPPPACAGPLHTVDVAGIGADGPEAVYNPTFAGEGGSPYEGLPMPLCSAKLVTVDDGRSIAPTFNLFTDVPIPGKWKGYIIDDLTLSTNPRDLLFGEKAGIPNAPIGVYDFSGNLFTTIQSDPNGVYEVLLPSTYSINCPTPSGVCPNVYYILGNDPGQPGRLNPNYNPQYRTIGASFEIWPGVLTPSDLAPTQIGVSLLAPGSTFTQPAACLLDSAIPELLAVSRPYVNVNATNGTSDTFVIYGEGFGAAPGATGKVTLDGTTVLPVTTWSDTQLTVSAPANTPTGPHQLDITAANGKQTIVGLTLHVRGPGYVPNIHEVGPGKPFATIQSAINFAAASPNQRAVIVVYPGAPSQWNPYGVYYENLVIYTRLKLQGVGPGGFRSNGEYVPGAIVDGVGVLGDTEYAAQWRALVDSLSWSGNQTIYEGPVITFLADDGEFRATFRNSVDGLTIQGGDQQGFPNFLPGAEPGADAVVTIQGGGIFANAYTHYLQITNNILRSNGGAYGGAIRLGTPNLPGPANDNQNDNVLIAHNRILANGGTNLAGAIGVFSGAENYEIAYNDVCGNFSAEYGGAISHYGYSPRGKIHHNRIYFNRSYDEGGGIMIAGELPANPAALSPGAGPVDVTSNLIQANLANDDGGGLRFLMAGNFTYNVVNNIIVNNISTHEGGGVSLNDAPNVRVVNNTIMKNLTTATAITSDGNPAPAGLSSSRNSAQLQVSLPPGSPLFSNPLLFNNIFWDNRAGSWTGGGVAGIGLQGDPNPINLWDLGVSDGTGQLAPTSSLMQTTLGTVLDPTNLSTDPQVSLPFDVSAAVLPWRGHPNFVDTLLVTLDLPVNGLGDYHLAAGSPAIDEGAPFKGAVQAPTLDIDGDARFAGLIDLGADEISTAPALNFPLTSVLDNFNRPNGSLGANWSGVLSAFSIVNQQVRVTNARWARWNAFTYGPNQEAFITLTDVHATAEQGVYLKLNLTNPDATNAALVYVAYDPITGSVSIKTKAPVQGWVTRATFAQTLADGAQIGGRVYSTGTVTAFVNGSPIGSADLTTGPTPWPTSNLNGNGFIGVRFAGAGLSTAVPLFFDNFGGGSLP